MLLFSKSGCSIQTSFNRSMAEGKKRGGEKEELMTVSWQTASIKTSLCNGRDVPWRVLWCGPSKKQEKKGGWSWEDRNEQQAEKVGEKLSCYLVSITALHRDRKYLCKRRASEEAEVLLSPLKLQGDAKQRNRGGLYCSQPSPPFYGSLSLEGGRRLLSSTSI